METLALVVSGGMSEGMSLASPEAELMETVTTDIDTSALASSASLASPEAELMET